MSKAPSTRTTIYVMLATALLTGSVARAANVLDIHESFRAALNKSELVQDQQELIYQAEENYNQAIGSILPNVSATAFYFQQATPSTAFTFATPIERQAKLMGSQPIFQGFREIYGLKQTKLLTKAQQQAKKQTILQLYQDLTTDFYQVLAAERDILDLQTESKLYEKRIDELNARVRIGRSRPAEVTQIQSSLESLYGTLQASMDQLNTARQTFAFLTGLSQDTPLRDPFKDDFNPIIEPLPSYVGKVKDRPDIQSYAFKRDAADEAVGIAKGGHLPSVDLTGDYYIARTGGFPGGTWDFQLAVTMPIFAGGTIQSKVRQAASQYREGELSVSRGSRLADQEIQTYYMRVQLDHAQVATLKRSKEYAWTNYQQQTRDYRHGLVTNIDVLQSLTALQEAERSLDRSKFQEKIDYLHLISAAGKADESALAF